MLFNSVHYLYFFIAVILLYYWVPKAYRWVLLLAASCYFYMVFIPQYILILWFMISIDYIAGILIDRAHGRLRLFYLIASLASNLGILSYFKYFNFLAENLNALTLSHFEPLKLILPLGLSFHTFQSISYSIEVYHGRFKPERHLGYFALYVLFFPQLVAGPIERPAHLLPQLRNPIEFSFGRAASGLRLILLGLFKKVLIADTLGGFTSTVFGDPRSYHGLDFFLCAYAFAIQVYCDFSGYTDIARGSACILGVDLVENFSAPFLATSLSEFWRRWHMALMGWFRDYVYIPLGGGRHTFINILLVFTISGLWHGAAWTFVVWGALHGLLVSLERILGWDTKTEYGFLIKAARAILVFQAFSLSLLIFRAKNMNDAWYMLTHLFTGWNICLPPLLLLLLFSLFTGSYYIQQTRALQFLQWPRAWRWAVYYGAFLAIVVFAKYESTQFIYFQF